MDRISTYRQGRLLVDLGRRGGSVALLARAVTSGRVDDRLIWRHHIRSEVPVRDIWGLVDMLEQAVAALRAEYPTPPSPEGPESPEGTTGGPVPQRGYAPEDPPLPGT